MKTANVEKNISKLEKAKLAIERKIETAKTRREVILAAEIQKHEKEAAALLMEAEGLKNGTLLPKSIRVATNRERVLPRGVLTLAIAKALRGTKGISATEVVEKLQEHKEFKKIPDLAARVRNSLNSNRAHFTAVARGVYKVHGKLEGALFERLREEELAVA